MLKSHFNLTQKEVEEEQDHESETGPKSQEDQASPKPDQASVVEGEHLGGYVVEDVPKSVYPETKLRKSHVSVNLSMLGKTAEGDGYTYLKATLKGMSLTNIDAIKCFRHLQFLDFSGNNLNLESLQVVTELPYLILIQADKNFLDSAALKKTKYLQVIILNNNLITSVENVYQPELSTLEVGFNNIQRLNFANRMPNIKCLDFRHNLISDISDINFPMLDSLYLAGNKIKSLVGLERLVNLRILHLRYNPIKSLDGFDSAMTKLQYINLRNCKVTTLRQIKKLRVLTALETLVLKGCPYMGGTGEEHAEVAQEEEDPELRTEVLATLPRLKRLNKGVFSAEERTEAKDLMLQWLEEGEKSEDEEIEEEQLSAEELNEDE